MIEGGGELGPWTATAKLHLANHLNWAAGFVARALGPRICADTGEWGTYAWLQLLLGVVGVRIGGGTDEVLRNTIAERVLGLFEAQAPHDCRPRDAIARTRAFARGDLAVAEESGSGTVAPLATCTTARLLPPRKRQD